MAKKPGDDARDFFRALSRAKEPAPVYLLFGEEAYLLRSALESVIKVGTQNKLPIFAADVDSVARGAVAAMGFDYYKHGYQTGAMAKKILEGAAPSSLPVEFQHELQLQINLKAAAAMGAPPPEELVKQAAKIYE